MVPQALRGSGTGWGLPVGTPSVTGDARFRGSYTLSMAATRTTLTVDEDLLDAARELGLNVSEAARSGIQRAVWAERHRRAVAHLGEVGLGDVVPSTVDTLDAVRRERDDELLRRSP